MTDGQSKTRALLLDIEGTVTPISFVHDVLFPFARAHVRDFLEQHSTSTDVQPDVRALVREHSKEHEKPDFAGSLGTIDWTVEYVNWLIDGDRKSLALKSLQGKIWQQGYEAGNLKAPLFDDVVPNLRRLRQSGLKVAIFSSGSALAQKLLFAHTETGDHTDLIDAFFDTAVGSKGSAASYQAIADRLELSPAQILFVSDVTAELEAARTTEMQTLLCVRPGNRLQPARDQFRVIQSLSEI